MGRDRITVFVRASGLMALAAVVVLALALTGCGSSKPAFCSSITNLRDWVEKLPASVSGGVSGVESQLAKVEKTAAEISSSAKSDFPSEVGTMEQRLRALKQSMSKLSSSPSPSDLTSITLQATAAVKAVDSFITAAHSKCS